jgi:hypothetical protein
MMACRFSTVINVGMAACTGASIGGPGNGLIIVGMAVIALNAGIVVSGVICRVVAEEYEWSPGIRAMTAITTDRRDKVRRTHAFCGAPVVAVAARLGDIAVVDPGILPGAGRGMAGITFFVGLHMCRWFARCGATVMAAAARLRDIRVVKAYGVPVSGIVTVIALAVGDYMTRWHTSGSEAIMAGFTCAYNRGVIDSANAAEADGVMAVIALWCGLNVCWRFANSDIVIVTGRAFTSHRTVIEARSAPGIYGMAVIAKIAAEDMLRVLARRADIVVTLAAIHRCALELAARVATRTVYKLMFSGEWKAGREMIKAASITGGTHSLSGDEI